MKETILIVDDDQEIRKLIKIYLQNDGYTCLEAANGLEAVAIATEKSIDLMILDVMMPEMDGISACVKIRETQNLPIIMLSAKSEDMDKIMGLTSGADDYLSKPFNPLELVARVKSQLRRFKVLNTQGGASQQEELIIDDLVINTATHEIHVGENPIRLTPREFEILELLARNRGIVFSTDKIYQEVWKEDPFESKNTVMVHIRKIREKIESDPRNPVYIKTVWGVGYKV